MIMMFQSYTYIIPIMSSEVLFVNLRFTATHYNFILPIDREIDPINLIHWCGEKRVATQRSIDRSLLRDEAPVAVFSSLIAIIQSICDIRQSQVANIQSRCCSLYSLIKPKHDKNEILTRRSTLPISL